MTFGCYRLCLGYEEYAGHNLFEHEDTTALTATAMIAM